MAAAEAAAEAAAVVAEKEPTPTACIISTYKLVQNLFEVELH